MEEMKKQNDADLVAEANHFRTEAIQQEIETGDRLPLLTDPVISTLPAGVQVSRPAFAKDHAAMSDAKKPTDKPELAPEQPAPDIAPRETDPPSTEERKPSDYPDLGGEVD